MRMSTNDARVLDRPLAPRRLTNVARSVSAVVESASTTLTRSTNVAARSDEPESSAGVLERRRSLASSNENPSIFRARNGTRLAIVSNPRPSSPTTALHPSSFSFVTLVSVHSADLSVPTATR